MNIEFEIINLARNFQKRIKCAARLLDRLEYLITVCKRMSIAVYSKTLKHALSTRKDLDENFINLIHSPLRVL